jgi:hypothetical protein
MVHAASVLSSLQLDDESTWEADDVLETIVTTNIMSSLAESEEASRVNSMQLETPGAMRPVQSQLMHSSDCRPGRDKNDIRSSLVGENKLLNSKKDTAVTSSATFDKAGMFKDFLMTNLSALNGDRSWHSKRKTSL